MEKPLPRVFVVGAGFGGIQAAKALANSAVSITLVDRRNHHVFQPLLYQVATAALSPADIAASIRHVFRDQENCQVVLGEITGVDLAKKHLIFRRSMVEYDYLILAVGATHSYFGHDEWAALAPGLKTLEDATQMRRRILLAFESAEYEGNETARRAALTFAIVGGGPTGVELAGAIKEIAVESIPEDFRHIDTRTTRVILFEGEDRLLPPFPPKLSERAKRDLERMGVEVRLNARVTNITADGIYIGEEFVLARNVFWAAGVKASPVGHSLGVPLDRAGRVIVGPDLSVPGHPEVFVIGDMASAKWGEDHKIVPGVAPAAIQMGRYAGSILASEIAGESKADDRKPFHYHDKGSLATIGKNKAVAQIGKWKFGGLLAWLLYGGVHIAFLIGFRNRVAVMASWFWNWLINARDARLITGDAQIHIEQNRSDSGILPKDPL